MVKRTVGTKTTKDTWMKFYETKWCQGWEIKFTRWLKFALSWPYTNGEIRGQLKMWSINERIQRNINKWAQDIKKMNSNVFQRWHSIVPNVKFWKKREELEHWSIEPEQQIKRPDPCPWSTNNDDSDLIMITMFISITILLTASSHSLDLKYNMFHFSATFGTVSTHLAG